METFFRLVKHRFVYWRDVQRNFDFDTPSSRRVGECRSCWSFQPIAEARASARSISSPEGLRYAICLALPAWH